MIFTKPLFQTFAETIALNYLVFSGLYYIFLLFLREITKSISLLNYLGFIENIYYNCRILFKSDIFNDLNIRKTKIFFVKLNYFDF